MGEMPRQGELMPELAIEKHWFHVTRAMFSNRVVAEMGPVAYTVYCCIKAHTALDTGRAWPSQPRIAELVGVSIDTVARATDKLIEMGYIRKERVGRRNEYKLTEKLPMIVPGTGEVYAQADVDYIPLQFQREISALERFCKSGVLASDSRINITFNVNVINQGANSTLTIEQNTEVVHDTSPRRDADNATNRRRAEFLRIIDN